jgi:hypothetical protein
MTNITDMEGRRGRQSTALMPSIWKRRYGGSAEPECPSPVGVRNGGNAMAKKTKKAPGDKAIPKKKVGKKSKKLSPDKKASAKKAAKKAGRKYPSLVDNMNAAKKKKKNAGKKAKKSKKSAK